LNIDKSLGQQILQNAAPLLKTMLFSSNKDIDIVNSINYSEREYFRFKNKYTQQIERIGRTGNLDSSTDPAVWHTTILQKINLGKTSSFPFSISGMGGENTFIPATPAYLGILPVWKPKKITDTSYGVARDIIINHDGSIFIAYGDYRDDIILYLENTIYDSINPLFKNTIPKYDYRNYVENKWKKKDNFDTFYNTGSAQTWIQYQYYAINSLVINNNTYYLCIVTHMSDKDFSIDFNSYRWLELKRTQYSINEFNLLLRPDFERWAILLQANYRKNSNYSQDDPFTWNYAQSVDLDGEPLPGYWRSIYRYFYGTDRPHISPWE
jgi:hypothetical protein